MSAIRYENLAAATVTYNGIQFGGGDAPYDSLPPKYSFSSRFVYDDAGIAVKATVYILTVQCIFFETAEGFMGANMEVIRRKLGEPGKELKILGLGTGFGTITHDEEWGPKPIGVPQFTPLGAACWELVWTIQFSIKECTNTTSTNFISAFNFSTTWHNDFEGICERSISGYAEIPVYHKNLNGSLVPSKVVDEIREQLKVVVPNGFKRTTNTWRENLTKNRLDFVIVDQCLPGTAYPLGLTEAAGNCSFHTEGTGFSSGIVTLNMHMKVSPSYPASLASVIFMTAAITKQQQMQTANNAKGATVMPIAFSISNGKFDEARVTSASMSWKITKCFTAMLKASNVYSVVTQGNYVTWKQSIENTWGNRGAKFPNGNGQIASNPNDVVAVTLCQNISDVTIGDSSSPIGVNPGEIVSTLTCPDVPNDGGWVYYDKVVRILRINKQSWHKKAVSYLPTPGFISTVVSPGSGVTNLGSFPYTQSASEEADVEHHGLPETYILLQFRGVRLKHKPEMPVITHVAGLPVTEVIPSVQIPHVIMDSLSCPVWALRGYRVYRVNGYVPAVKAIGSEDSCTVPDDSPGRI